MVTHNLSNHQLKVAFRSSYVCYHGFARAALAAATAVEIDATQHKTLETLFIYLGMFCQAYHVHLACVSLPEMIVIF